MLRSATSTALTALADGDPATALHHLLAAWRAAPAVALAEAIEVVGARAAIGLSAPTGKTVAARNATWTQLAEAGDPVMRGPLLASIAEINNFPGLTERIKILVGQPPDPRVAQRIVELIETPAFSPTIPRHRGNWFYLWGVLTGLGDPRVLVRARGFAQRWAELPSLSANQRAELVNRLGFAMPALTAAYGDVPELAAEDAAIATAIVVEATSPVPATLAGQRSEAELLAAIYAAPDDDGPRAVYADFLQERGDPRGEFIALQLAPRRTKDSRSRERELLAEYAPRWVAALGPDAATPRSAIGDAARRLVRSQTAVRNARFERGFVIACEADRERGFGDGPAWATVRACDRLPRSDACHATSLRVVTGAFSNEIAALATLKKPLAIEELHWHGPAALGNEAWAADDPPAIAAWPTIRVLPNLRRLSAGSGHWFANAVAIGQLAWVWRAPIAAALDELTLQMPPRLARDVLAELEPSRLKRFAIRADGGYEGVGWRMVFERDAAGAFSELTIHVDPRPPGWGTNNTWGDGVVAAIPALPALRSARVVVATRTADLFAGTVRDRLIAAFDGRGEHLAIEPL